jgi:transposase/DNA-binding phage protein
MWTKESRRRYDRSGLRYESDLTDDEWAEIAPLIPPAKPGGNKRSVDLREVVNGLMYILSTGCQWRAIPKDLAARSTLYGYFDRWSWEGTLERIHHSLYLKCRQYRSGARLHQEDSEDSGGGRRAGAQTDEGDAGLNKKNPHWGSTLDDFLLGDGTRDAARAEAVTRVLAWQLGQEMQRQGMTKARLAELMQTSRAQVDRILKANGNVTVATLQRAASLVGRDLRIELV